MPMLKCSETKLKRNEGLNQRTEEKIGNDYEDGGFYKAQQRQKELKN